MKQILLMIAVVAVVASGEKEAFERSRIIL
jgi:hypothetical protein